MSRPMRSAHAAPSGLQVGINESIQVAKGLVRSHAGSCNACTPETQATGYETVTEVQLRGLNFRLCPACTKTLKTAL
jgi:hypothetical protein